MKRGIGNENLDPPPCMFTQLPNFFFTGALRPRKPSGGRGKNGTGNESPGPPPRSSHSSRALILDLFLSWYFTSTETVRLIRDEGRMGRVMRAQFTRNHDALGPQEP